MIVVPTLSMAVVMFYYYAIIINIYFLSDYPNFAII